MFHNSHGIMVPVIKAESTCPFNMQNPPSSTPVTTTSSIDFTFFYMRTSPSTKETLKLSLSKDDIERIFFFSLRCFSGILPYDKWSRITNIQMSYLQKLNNIETFIKEIGQKGYVPYDRRFILALNLSPNAPKDPRSSTPTKEIVSFPQISQLLYKYE